MGSWVEIRSRVRGNLKPVLFGIIMSHTITSGKNWLAFRRLLTVYRLIT
jgi:hypothetical protein